LFGKIQPKATSWLSDSLLIGSWNSTDLIVETRMFADNLPQPVSTYIKLLFQTEERDADLEDYERLEFARFRATDKGREMFPDNAADENNGRTLRRKSLAQWTANRFRQKKTST